MERKVPGIRKRHSSFCPAAKGGECTAGRKGSGRCKPTFEAFAYDRRTRTKHRQTFPTLAAARGWRTDMLHLIGRGHLSAPSKTTLREAAEDWLARAESGAPLARGGRAFKPSVLRGYRADLMRYVLADLGALRLTEIRRSDFKQLAERLRKEGLSPSKVKNVLVPVRSIYRDVMDGDDGPAVNPTTGLNVPGSAGTRDRAVGIDEAEQLIRVLPEEDRPLWATAFYAGLRRGELQAIRWTDVDLAAGLISVERSWDPQAGYVAPKSAKGVRRVPMMGALRDYLTEHKARTGRDGDQLVFGSKPTHPFTATNIRRKALVAWARENVKRAERELDPLQPIGLHELRHSCVTFMSEAGLSLEEIGDLVGHSSTYMSDRYRHLRADHRDALAAKLDAYALLASTSSRIEQLSDGD
jgi:integrase